MSPGSARRLRHLLASVDFDRHATCFITLTYADDSLPGSPFEAKRHLHRYERELSRLFKGRFLAFLWVQEFQDRKSGDHVGEYVQHFHSVLFLRGGRLSDSDWLAVHSIWHRITGSQDVHHEYRGCDIRDTYNTKGAKIARLMGYLTKYLSKGGKTGFETGRVWGVSGDLPIVVQAFAFTYAEGVKLMRRIRAWGKANNNGYARKITVRWRGFLVYGDGLLGLGQLLRGLVVIPIQPL